MMNKRGWMRILEATVAVLIVAGVMISVYSDKINGDNADNFYFYDLQIGVLNEISSDADLRLKVLNVVVESSSDSNFDQLSDFIEDRLPSSIGFSLRVCDLGSPCKMFSDDYTATLDKSIYVEEVVISAEIGSGPGATYSPKKIRLFVWEV
jgi:hypothetical protein